MIRKLLKWDRPLLLEELKRIEDASKRGIPFDDREGTRRKTQVVKRILNLASHLIIVFLCGSLDWAISSWQLLMERYEALPIPCRHAHCLPQVTIRMAIYFCTFTIANAFAILPFRCLRRRGKIDKLLILVGGFFTFGIALMASSKYLVIDPYLPAFFSLGVAAAGIREAYYSAAFRTKSSGMLWAAGWMIEKTGACMPMMLLTNFKHIRSLESLLSFWTITFTLVMVVAMCTVDEKDAANRVPEQTSRFPLKSPLLFKQSLKGQLQSWVFMTLVCWSSLIMLRLSLYPITAIEHYRQNSSPNSKSTIFIFDLVLSSLDHTTFGIGMGSAVFNTAIWYCSETAQLSSAVGIIGIIELVWSRYARWISLRSFALSQVLIMPLKPGFESFIWEYCERMFGYQAFAPTWAILQIILGLVNSVLVLIIVSKGLWSSVMLPLDITIAILTVLFVLFLRFIDH